ncbi:hypothetical protein [Massilia sp. TSP1-1-2]|uniref:hypothetical protein n=1 Tax=Massilia sp. TSP1-1-2 TaxID=2804649 RepID=UPI003CEDC0D8
MTEKSNRPFVTDRETLTDGSEVWYVLHADTLEKIASASYEAAVSDLVVQLNEVCEEWADASPDHNVIEEGLT